jgi:hypothetical protein
MKKSIALFLVFLSLPFFSQVKKKVIKNIGFINGKIVDSKTKTPLSYINITCKNKSKIIITGGITDNQGDFLIDKLPLDSIFIDVQFIGYKTIKKLIVLSENQQKFDVSTLFLEEDINTLDEVVIQSETSTIVQKIDRRVINVGKDLASSGTNSLQLLENIPSVQVNFSSRTISLRGNSNVRVLIDENHRIYHLQNY